MDSSLYSIIMEIYVQLMFMTFFLPVAFIGYIIGRLVERRRIMKTLHTLEDEDEND